MNKAMEASKELKSMDELSLISSPVRSLCPLSKLFFTILYIFVVVSFNKYDFIGLLALVLFPLLGYFISTISVGTCFRKLKIVLPLVVLVGLFNPLFDQNILFSVGTIEITGGMVSMVTLMMKGIFSLMMSFLLIATTPIEEICTALRMIKMPKMLVVLVLLTYRYIGIMLDEVGIMYDSYMLRAPGHKGIHVSAWGSFLGQLILRSMDKSTNLYESMTIRGFNGEFDYRKIKVKRPKSWAYILITSVFVIVCRLVSVPVLLGSLFV